MSDRNLQYRRLHNLLLVQKHLTLREGSSPFILILDSVEQSAKPLTQRYIDNAKISKINAIFISYETLRPPKGIIHFIKARWNDAAAVQKEIAAVTSHSKRTLIILDTLTPLANSPTTTLPTFLSALLAHPHTILLAIYHTDIPLSPSIHTNNYAPGPLPLLRYLATTIFTTHSLPQTLARKRAAERSLPEPVFGLAEEREGVLVGMGANVATIDGSGGLVLEAEFRRKSGRAIEEWFFVPAAGEGKVGLLDDYPGYNCNSSTGDGNGANGPGLDDGVGDASTFELSLTEKQRRDREGVVLPYFDAQRGVMGEAGAGGRILYEFGVEDDFDEEEDEI